MTKSGEVSVPLVVEEALDLESTATDAVRFVPVELRDPDAAVLEPDVRNALDFSPAAFAIFLLQSNDLSDATTGDDDFNRLDRADDLEIHLISSYARCQERGNKFSPRAEDATATVPERERDRMVQRFMSRKRASASGPCAAGRNGISESSRAVAA